MFHLLAKYEYLPECIYQNKSPFNLNFYFFCLRRSQLLNIQVKIEYIAPGLSTIELVLETNVMETTDNENIYLDQGNLNCLSDSAFFLENWIDWLQEETFESVMIPFLVEEAKALVVYRDEARRQYYSEREGNLLRIEDCE